MLLVLGDLLLALFAVYAGSAVHAALNGATDALLPASVLQASLFIMAALFSSFLVDRYNIAGTTSTRGRAARTAAAMLLSFIMLSVLHYFVPGLVIERGPLFLALVIFGIGQLLWHETYTAFLNLHGLSRKVLVVGTGEAALQIGGVIKATNHQHVLHGYFSCSPEAVSVPAQDIVGKGNGLIQVVDREKPQKIVISLSERRGFLPVREILSCKLNGIEIVDAASFYEQLTGKLFLEDLKPSSLIFSEGFKTGGGRRLYKRGFDIFFSAFALLVVLPSIPLISLAIKIDSPGPVFFKQRRTGERELPFELIKFRTMKADAEKETGPVWAQKNDDRVTRVGRLLRKFRLDELPQFFNVLKGEMSLIGPRPERPEFAGKLKELIPFYTERHSVKPGITGWAQIKYPYGASVSDALEKLKFDLFYIKNMSPLLDALILLETVKVVLFGRGGR